MLCCAASTTGNVFNGTGIGCSQPSLAHAGVRLVVLVCMPLMCACGHQSSLTACLLVSASASNASCTVLPPVLYQSVGTDVAACTSLLLPTSLKQLSSDEFEPVMHLMQAAITVR